MSEKDLTDQPRQARAMEAWKDARRSTGTIGVQALFEKLAQDWVLAQRGDVEAQRRIAARDMNGDGVLNAEDVKLLRQQLKGGAQGNVLYDALEAHLEKYPVQLVAKKRVEKTPDEASLEEAKKITAKTPSAQDAMHDWTVRDRVTGTDDIQNLYAKFAKDWEGAFLKGDRAAMERMKGRDMDGDGDVDKKDIQLLRGEIAKGRGRNGQLGVVDAGSERYLSALEGYLEKSPITLPKASEVDPSDPLKPRPGGSKGKEATKSTAI